MQLQPFLPDQKNHLIRYQNCMCTRVATIPQNRESVIADYLQDIKKNLPIHESFFTLPSFLLFAVGLA